MDRSSVEFLGPRESDVVQDRISSLVASSMNDGDSDEKKKMLALAFVSMVFVGLMNKVFNKLMTIPMYNYPNFLNLLTSFVYVPVCFSYIIPMVRNGGIPKEQLEVPKSTFAIMGALDACAGIMQIFGATYLPGPLLILLLQAAIPMSMVISKLMLGIKYTKFQYMGAVIVAAGIMVVLAPSLTGSGDVLWCIVLIASTIPMALSSVYKEIALGETELDPIYLNGWVAVFQFLFSLVLCIPASVAADPPVDIPHLPSNLWHGLKCYVGINSVTCATDDDDGCSTDHCDPASPIYVNIYLFFNLLYNQLIILIIKFGSSNILYLALTLMVPLGNVAFTLPFVPGHSQLRPTDIIGLIVICGGLGCYRFANEIIDCFDGMVNGDDGVGDKFKAYDFHEVVNPLGTFNL